MPTVVKPTDAMIRISATCACSSDMRPSRGTRKITAGPAERVSGAVHIQSLKDVFV